MDSVPGDESLAGKYDGLLSIVTRYRKPIIAFSGGVDSLLLLHAAVEVHSARNVLAVMGVAPVFPDYEIKHAEKLASDLGVKLYLLETNIMKDRQFIENPHERCYLCRKNLAKRLKGKFGPSDCGCGEGDIQILDGANVSDMAEYRPGFTASQEEGVAHPIIEAGLEKDDIRRLLEWIGYPMEVFRKISSPCLATRIPYGQTITLEKLIRSGKAEEYLKGSSIHDIRVRHYEIQGEPTAGVELSMNEMDTMDEIRRVRIVTELKGLGFTRVFLDLEGFRSGSLDENLDEDVRMKWK